MPDHGFGIPLSVSIVSGGQSLDVSSSNINDQHVHDQFNPSPYPLPEVIFHCATHWLHRLHHLRNLRIPQLSLRYSLLHRRTGEAPVFLFCPFVALLTSWISFIPSDFSIDSVAQVVRVVPKPDDGLGEVMFIAERA